MLVREPPEPQENASGVGARLGLASGRGHPSYYWREPRDAAMPHVIKDPRVPQRRRCAGL